MMQELNVRIVRLEPLRVASALGFGPSPESLAWEKILAWAEQNGALGDAQARWFGFNNPSPSAGSPNYGYEQWMTVGPEAQASADAQIKEVPGGLYAVTRCEGLPSIEELWQALSRWREGSGYAWGGHQWLEECLTPDASALEDYVFDLYLPIAE